VELEVSQSGWGNGPLVIFLHGFPECRHMWTPHLPSLAAQGWVALAPDQRGYNRSSKPRAISAYDLDLLAGDVSDLAAAFGRRKYSVIGHDWGASVGWWLASTRPREIERLLAFSAPHPAAWREAMLLDANQRRRSNYVRLLRLPWVPELLIRLGAHQALERPLARFLDSEQLASYREAWRQEGALTGMINWYRALLKRRFGPPDAYRTDVPLLFATGALDPYLASATAKLSAGLCSNGEYVQLPNRGHWLIHEDPETVSALIGAFMTGEPLSALAVDRTGCVSPADMALT